MLGGEDNIGLKRVYDISCIGLFPSSSSSNPELLIFEFVLVGEVAEFLAAAFISDCFALIYCSMWLLY
jgi:hypothetical protein